MGTSPIRMRTAWTSPSARTPRIVSTPTSPGASPHPVTTQRWRRSAASARGSPAASGMGPPRSTKWAPTSSASRARRSLCSGPTHDTTQALPDTMGSSEAASRASAW